MTLNTKSPTLKFSVSGMRGLFGTDLHPGNIPAIINALHQSLPPGKIAIARDNRPTGIAIEQIVAGVAAALGRDIDLLGLVPTPTIKNHINLNKLAGGVMISASHNPVEYTAFKFIKKGGLFFDEKDNKRLHEAIKKETFNCSITKQGSLNNRHNEAVAQHIESILQKVPINRKSPPKLRVAIDTLGACAHPIAPKLLETLKIKYFSLFPEIHYSFPRGPEPVAASLKKLGKFVVENRCDIGFAFDPDADRLAVVNSSGKPIGEELTLPLAILEAMKTRKGDLVVNLSSSFYNNIASKAYKRKVYRSKVGEANVVSLMSKRKAGFGGEGNGGVIDPKIPSYGRDALAAMAWILALLINNKRTLESYIAELGQLSMEKIAIKGDQKVLHKITKRLEKQLKGWEINREDGIHFSNPEINSWIHIRSSNTEPVIRIIAETPSPKSLKELLALARSTE